MIQSLNFKQIKFCSKSIMARKNKNFGPLNLCKAAPNKTRLDHVTRIGQTGVQSVPV